MAKIFINYRRNDEAGYAGWLYSVLERRFGAEVFLDVFGIDHSGPFNNQLTQRVSECVAFLVVVGPRWLDAIQKRQADRLNEDYVLKEIQLACEMQKLVIPVLVGEKPYKPVWQDLPGPVQHLSRQQQVTLRHEAFADDCEALIRKLYRARPELSSYVVPQTQTTTVVTQDVMPPLESSEVPLHASSAASGGYSRRSSGPVAAPAASPSYPPPEGGQPGAMQVRSGAPRLVKVLVAALLLGTGFLGGAIVMGHLGPKDQPAAVEASDSSARTGERSGKTFTNVEAESGSSANRMQNAAASESALTTPTPPRLDAADVPVDAGTREPLAASQASNEEAAGTQSVGSRDRPRRHGGSRAPRSQGRGPGGTSANPAGSPDEEAPSAGANKQAQPRDAAMSPLTEPLAPQPSLGPWLRDGLRAVTPRDSGPR